MKKQRNGGRVGKRKKRRKNDGRYSFARCLYIYLLPNITNTYEIIINTTIYIPYFPYKSVSISYST